MRKTQILRYGVRIAGVLIPLTHIGWTEDGLFILETEIGTRVTLAYHSLVIWHI